MNIGEMHGRGEFKTTRVQSTSVDKLLADIRTERIKLVRSIRLKAQKCPIHISEENAMSANSNLGKSKVIIDEISASLPEYIYFFETLEGQKLFPIYDRHMGIPCCGHTLLLIAKGWTSQCERLDGGKWPEVPMKIEREIGGWFFVRVDVGTDALLGRQGGVRKVLENLAIEMKLLRDLEMKGKHSIKERLQIVKARFGKKFATLRAA